jgi:hypothetical protein
MWPIVLSGPAFWLSFLLYILVEVGSRILARRLYGPPSKEHNAKALDVVGRYPPSFVHALLTAVFMWLKDPLFVAAHSSGYFIADVLVDRDLEYIPHHLSPIFLFEIGFRFLQSQWNGMFAFAICEIGNVFSHAASLLTFRTGKVWEYTTVISFWLSRPLSFVWMMHTYAQDVPLEFRWSTGGMLMLAFLVWSYGQNLYWMIKMLLPQKPADETGDSNTVKSTTTDRVAPPSPKKANGKLAKKAA